MRAGGVGQAEGQGLQPYHQDSGVHGPDDSHGPIQHDELAGEVDGVILDGQQDVLDLGRAPTAAGAAPQVHGELLVGVAAVGGEVVVAQPREVEDVAVEGLVVEIAPVCEAAYLT